MTNNIIGTKYCDYCKQFVVCTEIELGDRYICMCPIHKGYCDRQ